MGNSASSSGRGQHDDTVDYGYLFPQGVYTGPRDWNHAVVTQLIIERKLAPFYRPLEEYEEGWDDERILTARKEFPDSDAGISESSARLEHFSAPRSNHAHRRPPSTRESGSSIPEAAVYRGAMECPICFLYYPPNINHSRCCDQAICTECFVQIKRNEPTTTHLVSEPAACPYCVQDNFGVTYTPPQWRAGLGSEGSGYSSHPAFSRSPSTMSGDSGTTPSKRRKSFGADSQEVVTIDHIRPDWEAKLAAVRAAVTRRANRRIIMRQVGDRLIPVGVTSGRVHPLEAGEQGEAAEGANESRSSRRSRRRQQQQQDLNQLLGSMGLGGQDLEELMVMEAMRLSLLDHEEQQRREAQNANTQGGNQQAGNRTGQTGDSPSSTLELSVPTCDPPLSVSFGNNSGSVDTPGLARTPVVPSPLGASGPTLATPTPTCPRTQGITERTPSPQPRHSQESLSGSGQRTPPFSTLSAAIAAHSSASAPLVPGAIRSTEEGIESETRRDTPTSAGTPQASTGDNLSADDAHVRSEESAHALRRCSTSSIIAGSGEPTPNSTYDILPSSPDSPEGFTSQQPLLPTRSGCEFAE